MAASMYAGTFGKLLLSHSLAEPPAAPPDRPIEDLPDLQQTLLRGMFARKTVEAITQEAVAGKTASPFQVSQALLRVRHNYGVRSNTHLMRRVVDVEGRDVLPEVADVRVRQQDMAARFSPRQIVYLGMLSHDVPGPETERLFGPYAGITNQTNPLTRDALGLSLRAPGHAFIASAMAEGLIAPDSTYLTPDYIVESLRQMADRKTAVIADESILPEGPYPYIKDQIA
jgi:hypothetical protein